MTTSQLPVDDATMDKISSVTMNEISVTLDEISSNTMDEISSDIIDEISNAMNEISPMLPWFIYHQLRVVRYLQLP